MIMAMHGFETGFGNGAIGPRAEAGITGFGNGAIGPRAEAGNERTLAGGPWYQVGAEIE